MSRTDNYIPVKRNLSSTQVLKTLSVLMEGNYTMSELIHKLNENEDMPVFNNSVVSKYINTCRFCGIEILKLNNHYIVANIPFGMDISSPEHNLMVFIKNEAQKRLTTNAYKCFEHFLEGIYRYSNKVFPGNEKNIYENTKSYFEKAIIDSRKVQITLRDKSSLKCIPVDIQEHNNKTYFRVIYDDKEKLILKDKVTGVSVLNDRCRVKKRNENVIYKLTGKLAYNYNIRENEKMIADNLPESVTIINYEENRDILIPRLLRYGELCEIISPSELREEIKSIVHNALANYGE